MPLLRFAFYSRQDDDEGNSRSALTRSRPRQPLEARAERHATVAQRAAQHVARSRHEGCGIDDQCTKKVYQLGVNHTDREQPSF